MSHGQMTTNDLAQMAAVRAFISEHGSAVLNASRLLGGPPARQRYGTLIDEIRGAIRLTRRMRQRLVDLHALLTLQHVGDPDRLETTCFAAIDPAAPVVEDICLVADALHDMLVAIAQDESDPVSDGDIRHGPSYQDAA